MSERRPEAGSPGGLPPRMARGPASSRQMEVRRRRALAALALVAVIAIVLVVVSGRKGQSHRASARAPAARRVSSGRPESGAGASGSANGARSPRVSVAQAGTLPLALQDASAVATGPESLLLIGGIDQREASVADILRVSAGAAASSAVAGSSSEAVRIGSLPTPLHDASASFLGGAVYLFGGGVLASYPQITRIDPASGATQPAGQLPTPASDVATAAIGETVYVVGGYTGSVPLRTILAWRPGQAARVVGELPKPLRYAAVAASGGELVIAGGTSGEEASSDIYRFDPHAGALAQIGRLPEPLTHASAASLGQDVLVFGGRGSSDASQRDTVLAIDPSGRVSVAGTLPEPLSDLAAVALGGRIVLAGGRDSAGRVHDSVLTVSMSSR